MAYQPIGRRRFLQGSAALIGAQSLTAGKPAPAGPQAATAKAHEQIDQFATMAIQPAPPLRVHLRENPPPSLPTIELESGRSNPSVDFPQRHSMQTREEFRARLAELRKQYEPFLADYTPTAPVTRARIELDTFQFRMEEPEDLRDISRVWRGEGSWQSVRLPHYRGPVGWWAGYYRKVLEIPASVLNHEAIVLRFGAVDYKCQVYLNGRMVTTHEGLFAPFEVDITPYLRPGSENVLVIRIQNEAIMLTYEIWSGLKIDGDKIAASVGPGWDDPVLGWHECPPGAGIWQKVYLEGRPKLAVTGLFVRPDLAGKAVEVRVEVAHRDNTNRDVDLTLSIYPKNFHGPALENVPVKAAPAGPGSTEYRTTVYLGDFRGWEPESPYLYTLRATLRPKDAGPVDVAEDHFGMREFRMDDSSGVKGTLYLNGEPIILRGANTMGNFEVPVMKGDEQQLIEDILIAKLAHMNFFRLTQTPVQPEVYDMCDHFGMMVQTDLPLFGQLRRGQLEEAIREAGEMEKLVRNHASNIMISYINEPTTIEKDNLAHRDLTRPELELFFEAASSVVHVHNPDRVIKPVDGDFDPPEPGLPDYHIYCAWYGSQGVPIGKFIRGYWMASKPGWKLASGEYGLEGLEDAETMFKHYPKDWLPAFLEAPWNPGKLPFAQTWALHGSWYDTQETLGEWIAASQAHQAWGIGTMTRAFRRQADRIVSTAMFFLIDAWPDGWQKSLVDVDRHPKPAYFEFREALTPLMVDIRTDRLRYYAGEKLQLEFWVCNDRRADFSSGELVWEVLQGGHRIFAQSGLASIPSFGAAFQGFFHYHVPEVTHRERLTIRVGLKDPSGQLIHDSKMEVEVFPALDKAKNGGVEVAIVGPPNGRGWKLAQTLGLRPHLFSPTRELARLAFVDDVDAFEMVRSGLRGFAEHGGTAVFLEQAAGTVWRLGEADIVVKKMTGREFVSRKTGHPLVASFQPSDFSYWYDAEKDYIEYVANDYLEGPGLAPILQTVVAVKPVDPDPKRKPVSAELRVGRGSLVVSQLKATERVSYEPVAAVYYQALIDRAVAAATRVSGV
jgi:hypothetical protein